MITRPSIAFEDFLGSSIAPQVMPPRVDVVVGVQVVDLKLVSAYYNPDIWRPAWRHRSRISTGIDDQPPAKNEKTGKMSKQTKMSTQHGTKIKKPM